MLTFTQYLSEAVGNIRGWMSPSGVPHIFDWHGEHAQNHHPEYLATIKRRAVPKWPTNEWYSDQVKKAQKAGFVRFGKAPDSLHGKHIFIHYDAKHPQGHATALKALKYLHPDHDEPVAISGHVGSLYSTKLNKQLTDRIMPAREAFRHLKQAVLPSREITEANFYTDPDEHFGFLRVGKRPIKKVGYGIGFHSNIARKHGFKDDHDAVEHGWVRYIHNKGDVFGQPRYYSNYEFKNTPDNIKEVATHIRKTRHGFHRIDMDIHHEKTTSGKRRSTSHTFYNREDALNHLDTTHPLQEAAHSECETYKDWGIIHPTTGEIISGYEHPTATHHMGLKWHVIKERGEEVSHWPEYAHVHFPKEDTGYLVIRPVGPRNKEGVLKAYNNLPHHESKEVIVRKNSGFEIKGHKNKVRNDIRNIL